MNTDVFGVRKQDRAVDGRELTRSPRSAPKQSICFWFIAFFTFHVSLLTLADDKDSSLRPPSSALRPWNSYRVIMWVGDSALQKPEKFPLVLLRFREMGVNTGMVHGDGDPKPWVDAHFPYYVENIVNKGLCLKWNSNVRDWDKFVTNWTKTGRKKEAFIRDYCLDDPEWLESAKNLMRASARKHKANHPIAYNIRDELSTTISANPFDYDFSPRTLASFRGWLKTQYKDLAALNTEWETKFATWDDVKPFTTDEIKNRMASGDAIPRGNPDWQAVQKLKFDPVEARKSPTRWNFSPWCDFRTYMDISLARVLGELRDAAHEIDPETPVGIEGTQMPSAFGGYDLWRLSQVLDWVEPYDIGCSREILGSFMPGKPILTTVFESDTNHAKRRLWHLLLEGDKGCLIWWSEDCIDWKSDDYALTPKAKALAPVLKEMQSPLAALFLRAQRQYDPIAIHYSQPSIQVDWLLESTEDGSTWHRRFSSYEAEHNRMAGNRNAQLHAIQNAGCSPRFIMSQQIENEELVKGGYQVFVTSNSIALSNKEIAEINQFYKNTNFRASVHDGAWKVFDEHGKLRIDQIAQFEQKLPQFLPTSEAVSSEILAPFDTLLSSYEVTKQNFVSLALQSEKSNQGGHTAIHRYTLGTAKLVAFERNINYHMSEDLKQAGGNEALEKPIDLEAKLAKPAHVYDLRAQKYLGQTDKISFTLDPWQPSLYALLPEKVDEKTVIEWLAKQK